MDECVTIAQARMQLVQADFQQRFVRKLGSENCVFMLFDLDTQLGVCYTNPETGKRLAARIRWDADVAAVDRVIHELRAGTGEGEGQMIGGLRR